MFGAAALLCLPLLIFASVAGVDLTEASIAYGIAATVVALTAVTLFQVRESLNGDPLLSFPLLWLLTDVLSLIGLCAALYMFVGVSQASNGAVTHRWFDAL